MFGSSSDYTPYFDSERIFPHCNLVLFLNYLSLSAMLTPKSALDYQRRGAATQHCQWGMKLAKERKVPITVFGSPVGQELYAHLGFVLLATVVVQVEGEEEKVSLGVMVYKDSC